MTQEALKLALDVIAGKIIALEESLAQEQRRLMLWPCHIIEADLSERTITLGMDGDYKVSAGTHWLSTTPPQRTWVDLTDEEMRECNINGDFMCDRETAKLNVQAKLKEKNT